MSGFTSSSQVAHDLLGFQVGNEQVVIVVEDLGRHAQQLGGGGLLLGPDSDLGLAVDFSLAAECGSDGEDDLVTLLDQGRGQAANARFRIGGMGAEDDDSFLDVRECSLRAVNGRLQPQSESLVGPLPSVFSGSLFLHRFLFRGVFDDDELLLVGVVAVFLVIGQHRQLDAVGLALLDDVFHELFVGLGLFAVECLVQVDGMLNVHLGDVAHGGAVGIGLKGDVVGGVNLAVSDLAALGELGLEVADLLRPFVERVAGLDFRLGRRLVRAAGGECDQGQDGQIPNVVEAGASWLNSWLGPASHEATSISSIMPRSPVQGLAADSKAALRASSNPAEGLPKLTIDRFFKRVMPFADAPCAGDHDVAHRPVAEGEDPAVQDRIALCRREHRVVAVKDDQAGKAPAAISPIGCLRACLPPASAASKAARPHDGVRPSANRTSPLVPQPLTILQQPQFFRDR